MQLKLREKVQLVAAVHASTLSLYLSHIILACICRSGVVSTHAGLQYYWSLYSAVYSLVIVVGELRQTEPSAYL